MSLLLETSPLILNPVHHFAGTLQLPGSKSISNRALLFASLASGKTRLHSLLHCDDVDHMQKALETLGVKIDRHETECEVNGTGMISHQACKIISLGNSGTCMRFLTAALSVFPNDVILTGDLRMQERPIHDLVEALRQGGAKIDYLKRIGYPPLRIYGGFTGGDISFEQVKSSQFISALLIAAPLATEDTCIRLSVPVVSKPYITMTISMMRRFGVKIIQQSHTQFYIPGRQQYLPAGDYRIEGDASSASYFLAGAAIKGGPVKIIGLPKNSLQGDSAFIDALWQMGAHIEWRGELLECRRRELKGIDINVIDIPDAAMTLAIVALFATGRTILRNIGTWRVKECDRLQAMATELRKVGALVEEGLDFICIDPPVRWYPATIETYNDHRMAMCFSLVSLAALTPVGIINPGCTTKTFPHYFEQFIQMTKAD